MPRVPSWFITGYLAYISVPPGFTIPYELPGSKPREVTVGLGLMMSIVTLGGAQVPPRNSKFVRLTAGSVVHPQRPIGRERKVA